ncbi:MAG: DUF4838 domain-containing protein [Saprospiraceae bacterium]|nr:DUF4838 domain-containing protein [Saprospiraceae bacterium]
MIPKIDRAEEQNIVIVIDGNASGTIRIAAEELQYYLKALYRWEVPVVHQTTKEYDFIYYIGESESTRKLEIYADNLKDDSYRVYGNGQFIMLVGNDTEYEPKEPYALSNSEVEDVDRKWNEFAKHDWQNPLRSTYRHYSKGLDVWEFDHCGSLQAVYGYLRRLGVRWYMPGAIGEVLPEEVINPKLDIDTSVTPAYPLRNQYHLYKSFFMASKDEILYRYRLGLNSGSEIIGHGSPGHGINYILASSDLKTMHPEYYGEIEGKRIISGPKILPCLSQNGLIDEAVEYAKTVFDIFDEPVLSIMPPDGFTSICQCQLCQNQVDEGRGGDGKYSDYVWNFVNEVAKRLEQTHPRKKVLCFAYSTYLLPPREIEHLSSNVQVGICRTRSSFHDSSQDSLYKELTLQWQEKCGSRKIVYWDYYLFSRPTNNWYAVPVIFPQLISDDLRNAEGSSLGEFVEVFRNLDEGDPISLATNHLNVFVTSQLYWDSKMNVEKVLKEYYSDFYGQAASKMETFFEFSEDNWPFIVNDPILIDSIFYLLGSALSVTKNDKAQERINLILKYVSPLLKIKEKLVRDQRQITERTFRAINRSRSVIIVDGFLEENIWDGLYPYEFYFISKVDASKYRRQKSNVRFVARGNTLYMGFQISKIGKESQKRNEIVNDSAYIIERNHLRINVNPLDGLEYTIIISPDGAVWDYSSGHEGSQWQSNVTLQSQEGEDSYRLELSIPIVNDKGGEDESFQGIVSEVPTAAYPWYINIFQTQFSDDGDKIESAIFLDRESPIPFKQQYAKIIYR